MATYGGQNVGAKKLDRLGKGLFACSIFGIVYSIVAFIIMYFAGGTLCGLFVTDASKELLDSSREFLLINAAFFIPLVFVNVIRYMIQGMGFSTFAILSGVFEMIARTLMGIFIVPVFGFTGACFASPLAWIMADMNVIALAGAGFSMAIITHVFHVEKYEPLSRRCLLISFIGYVLVLLILLAGIIVIVYGCKTYGWYFPELAASFTIMGILSAIVMGWGLNDIAKKYELGFTNVAMACMMIGLARGILMVLQAGNIIDTVVYYFSLPLASFPSWFCGVAMLVMQTLLNFLIPSGSGQAATSMPIMAPLADLLGISRDTAVLAFQFGDGLSNIVWPTGFAAIMSGLAGVKIQKWWRFVVPVFLCLFVTQAILMIVAVLIGFGAY